MLVVVSGAVQMSGQNAAPAPVTFTSEQDHQNMMDQLGHQGVAARAERE